MGAQVAHVPPRSPTRPTRTSYDHQHNVLLPRARGHTRSRSPAPEHYTTHPMTRITRTPTAQQPPRARENMLQ